MRRSSVLLLIKTCLVAVLFSTSSPGLALAQAINLVPETTKGLFVIPDVKVVEASWNNIELGKLAADPKVKPFMDDLQQQIQAQLDKTGVRVGVSLEELFEVCTGEIALAFVEPRKGSQKHSVATIADVEGKADEIAVMREKIKKTMASRKATQKTQTVDGVELDIYTVPLKVGGRKTFQAVFFSTNDKVVAVDHEDVAKEILALIQGNGGKTLKTVDAYSKTMDRVDKESDGLAPHIHWWVEPLAYAKLTREAAALQKKRRWDVIDALTKQGFDAIRGLGGHVNLGAEVSADGPAYDLVSRAYCYAPAVKGAGKERYKKTARLLALPGDDDLTPQDWVTDDIGTYITATWKIGESYEYVGSLVDEIAGEEGFFEDLIASLKDDPNGPRISLKQDIVDHLKTRATVMTDCLMPITPESERFLVAIDLKDAEAFKKTLAKVFGGDPNARLLEIDDHEIWEIINEDVEAPVVDVQGGGDFEGFDTDDDDGGAAAGALVGNAALSVVKGHLLISSHVDFIVEVMRRKPDAAKLAELVEFRKVGAVLAEMGGTDSDTLRLFSRVDEELKATYAFIKKGEMPESKGLLGRALNQLLSTDDQEGPREQQINGKKMPDYKAVRKYLGPIGMYIRAEDDGFYAAAVGLSRDQAINKTGELATREKDDTK